MRAFVCFLVLIWSGVAAGAAENVIHVSSSIIPAAQIAQDALLLPGRGDAASCDYNGYHKKYGTGDVRSCCRRASGLSSIGPTSAGARMAIRP